MYTAIVLDKQSRQKLVQHFAQYIPGGYEILADHMTINMGNISKGPLDKNALGMEVEVIVVSVAADEKVIAVGVETIVPSKNSNKHITLAVNREAGGKPFMSNKLTTWDQLPEHFELTGTILEV